MSAVGPAAGLQVIPNTPILLFMVGEAGRDHSLPLLPAGSALFEQLPARALVLEALAPAVGNGIITVIQRDRFGVLIVREGVITDAVGVHDNSRDYGDAALTLIRSWESAAMSAYSWSESAMSLLEPLVRGEPRYEDLRLEWTAWPRLLDDLRSRGETFVVELLTPNGRGVTVLRHGEQVATYSESHPSIGDAELMDVLVAEGAGSVRVLAVPGTTPPSQSLPGAAAASRPSAWTDALTQSKPGVATSDTDAANAVNTSSEVGPFLPSLKLLARARLQRSSGPIEDVVDAAAADRQTIAWLAGRVRVMSVRGFMTSTLEQLADDMLALAERA
jgi:hypothetical protein